MSVVSPNDISLMSRQSGTEFASITVGDRHYIIKGDRKGTPISQELFEAMKENKGTLNCHAHPYIGDLQPSIEDVYIAETLNWQDEFYIVTPDGRQAIYNKMGLINVKNIEEKMTEYEMEQIIKLFGG